jgi:hypothetical protein
MGDPKAKQESIVCVICGVNPPSTGKGDHVPPQGLYTLSEKTANTFQFHTVPACISCNGAGSGSDEELKLLIGIASGGLRPFPDEIVDGIGRTIDKNARLGRELFDGLIEYSDGSKAFVFNEVKYQQSLSRLARGMYWRMTNTILDAATKITIIAIHPHNKEANLIIQPSLPHHKSFEVNGGTLKCTLEGDNRNEIMTLRFFDCHTAVAIINHT